MPNGLGQILFHKISCDLSPLLVIYLLPRTVHCTIMFKLLDQYSYTTFYRTLHSHHTNLLTSLSYKALLSKIQKKSISHFLAGACVEACTTAAVSDSFISLAYPIYHLASSSPRCRLPLVLLSAWKQKQSTPTHQPSPPPPFPDSSSSSWLPP
jgi:hypothetical protein